MRSASVGLTLTCASRLFLMEPCLNLAQEAQAIGRLHRFGQTEEVEVVRFLLKGTVDERVLAMRQKRLETPQQKRTLDAYLLGNSEAAPSASADAESETIVQRSLDIKTLSFLLE